MFSKLQQQQHLFQPSCEPQTSEDDDSRNSPITAQKPISDGATIETLRRPRGRPPGSKNRPKPPLIITREPDEHAMSPNIFEIPTGSDVVKSIAQFSHRRNIGLCVLTASGTVVDVTLRQPSVTPNTAVKFHGCFEILSISATFIPQPPETSSPVPNGFFISLAGPQGQIIGGFVVGPLLAAGTVFVTAASFNNPSYHKLPLEEEVRRNSVSGDGDVKFPVVSGVESCMYSSHLASDVIWSRSPF